MLGQTKTAFQAEIDSACELIDFWRFNPAYAQELYDEQPVSDHTMWNQLDYRPLEGFVYAVTPFNFTSIGGNLPTAPALMGNTVLWKPASTAMLSSYVILRLLEEAGLPPGVINFVPGDAAAISDVALSHRDLAGVHFTGSTEVFNGMWKTIGGNMARYRSYPRIVGETGGKDFIVAHASADPQALAVAIARGGFEYQGQKCSAVCRVYVPRSIWDDVRDRTVAIMKYDQDGRRRPTSATSWARSSTRRPSTDRRLREGRAPEARVVPGGKAKGERGVLHRAHPHRDRGPRPPAAERGDLRPRGHRPRLRRRAVDGDPARPWTQTSPYALTGAVFAQDRRAARRRRPRSATRPATST